MEENIVADNKTDCNFKESIIKIIEIRMSSLDARRKIEKLASITDDFEHNKGRNLFARHAELTSGKYDINMLCEMMLNMAEGRMVSHEILHMEDLEAFITLILETTPQQETPIKGREDFKHRCLTIQDLTKELMSNYSEMEAAALQKDYFQICLNKALLEIERLDNEKKKLKGELADLPMMVENQVLMNLIEIAKNKSLQTRQGIKSLLQDYFNKKPISKISLDFREELATLDNERPQPKTVNVNGGGTYNDIHDNKEVITK